MTYPLLTAGHLKHARVIERDPRGIKVLQLPDGDYLKVFRLRHRYSLARLYGYAQRFCSHAGKLAALGIPSIRIRACYAVQDARLLAYPLASRAEPMLPALASATLSHTYAVHYAPLPGQTLKQLLDQQQLPPQLVRQLGAFIAELHAKGVHFRSLHLGNIVLTPAGELGLIDIADMKIYPWPLWFGTRLRSFRHLTRYARMNAPFGESNWEILVDSYIEQAALSACKASRLKKKMQHYLLHPPH
ncbi:toluene tolerance protein [Methylophilus sp.]|uniref:toluene tolerance protein n=1 Tax=Methylophilus sp. TaxID=29541 RepID=UPI0040362B74